MCNCWSKLFSLLTGGKLRPHQRFIYLLTIWMCLCYGVFHVWIAQDRNWITSRNYKVNAANDRDNNRRPEHKISIDVINKTIQKKDDNHNVESFIQELAPNVPYEFWVREKAKISNNKNKIKNKCASFPSVFDLRFNNK